MKVTPKQYAKFLLEIKEQPEAEHSKLVKKLAVFMKANRDTQKLNQAIELYKKVKDKKRGVIRLKVFTREKLKLDTTENLKIFFADKYNSEKDKIIIENIKDKKLLGGILIQKDDEVWDGTVFSKINKIKAAISN